MSETQKRLLECRNHVRARVLHLRGKRSFLTGHNFHLQAHAVNDTCDELEKIQFALESALDKEGIEYTYSTKADPEHT